MKKLFFLSFALFISILLYATPNCGWLSYLYQDDGSVSIPLMGIAYDFDTQQKYVVISCDKEEHATRWDENSTLLIKMEDDTIIKLKYSGISITEPLAPDKIKLKYKAGSHRDYLDQSPWYETRAFFEISDAEFNRLTRKKAAIMKTRWTEEGGFTDTRIFNSSYGRTLSKDMAKSLKEAMVKPEVKEDDF